MDLAGSVVILDGYLARGITAHLTPATGAVQDYA
eukprot:CAMPEP_0174742924 /NCGR_PEP_ID=MMETSP1094-20130205/80298_1 /TAXON_ID=156173 /ORGANISM="Chrysochromulina brevifilum, Strain UTEX LB 985" /LENGTH=33 /DNA_ID= /DNA_START= /DNA_END= /DNA_ORIENTATION=